MLAGSLPERPKLKNLGAKPQCLGGVNRWLCQIQPSDWSALCQQRLLICPRYVDSVPEPKPLASVTVLRYYGIKGPECPCTVSKGQSVPVVSTVNRCPH